MGTGMWGCLKRFSIPVRSILCTPCMQASMNFQTRFAAAQPDCFRAPLHKNCQPWVILWFSRKPKRGQVSTDCHEAHLQGIGAQRTAQRERERERESTCYLHLQSAVRRVMFWWGAPPPPFVHVRPLICCVKDLKAIMDSGLPICSLYVRFGAPHDI